MTSKNRNMNGTKSAVSESVTLSLGCRVVFKTTAGWCLTSIATEKTLDMITKDL